MEASCDLLSVINNMKALLRVRLVFVVIVGY